MTEDFSKNAALASDVVLVCFSLRDYPSLEFALNQLKKLRKWGVSNIILVGCKADEREANFDSHQLFSYL